MEEPLLSITAWQRRCIGIRSHSSSNAIWSWSSVSGYCALLLTYLSNWSQRCSIGERCGKRVGQGSTSTLFWCKKSVLTLATCGRALLCWNVAPFAAIKGSTWGVRISFLYLSALRLLLIVTRCVCLFAAIPPHIITLPRQNGRDEEHNCQQNVHHVYDRLLSAHLLDVTGNGIRQWTGSVTSRHRKWRLAHSKRRWQWHCVNMGPW